MQPRITEILTKMKQHGNERQVSVQLGLMAELQALISAEQAESAAKIERQTQKIIGLTWAIAVLTAALFLLTVYLCYDAYLKARTDHEAKPHATEQYGSHHINAA